MKVSDLMQAMADAGAPMEAILVAVRAVEDERAAIEQRRSADRERKRRQRERDVTVTGQSRDTDVTVTDAPSLSRPPNEKISNPPTHTHPSNNTRARKAVSRPEAVSEQVWEDFTKHRKRLKADITETALQGILREADKARWPLEAALAECVARGWRGFKAEWVNDGKQANGSGKPSDQRGSTRATLERVMQQMGYSG